MEIPASRVLGMLAGLLIFLVGAFVLKAKPGSALHRLFFAFAAADGISTFSYDLALTPGDAFLRTHAYLFYFHAFIAFIGLLFIFGLLFPRALIAPRLRVPTVVLVGALTLGLIVWHALSPETFWRSAYVQGDLTFSYAPAGLLVAASAVAIFAALVVRLAILLRIEPSPSHRRQAAFVLGAMALGFTPYATTTFVEALRVGFASTLFSSSGAVAAVYWTSAISVIAILAAAASLLLDAREDRRDDHRVVIACFAIVAVLTAVAVLVPGRAMSDLLQVLGLVAYPLILAYAIARFEILDIGPAVRRTALLSLATTVLAAGFFMAEAALQALLEERLSGAVGVPLVAAVVAGIATLALFAPISKLAKRVTRRIAPEITAESRPKRQREIYMHGLEAAIADGIVDPRESRVLTRMRDALGVTIEDHDAMMREISTRHARSA